MGVEHQSLLQSGCVIRRNAVVGVHDQLACLQNMAASLILHLPVGNAIGLQPGAQAYFAQHILLLYPGFLRGYCLLTQMLESTYRCRWGMGLLRRQAMPQDCNRQQPGSTYPRKPQRRQWNGNS